MHSKFTFSKPFFANAQFYILVPFRCRYSKQQLSETDFAQSFCTYFTSPIPVKLSSPITIIYLGSIFSLISLFWNNRVGLWDDVTVCMCMSVYPPYRCWATARQKSHIVARQRLGKNLHIVARQRLGRNVTAVTNTHVTIEDLLDASFSMWPVSYQGK
jgi:hypothetical protein